MQNQTTRSKVFSLIGGIVSGILLTLLEWAIQNNRADVQFWAAVFFALAWTIPGIILIHRDWIEKAVPHVGLLYHRSFNIVLTGELVVVALAFESFTLDFTLRIIGALWVLYIAHLLSVRIVKWIRKSVSFFP